MKDEIVDIRNAARNLADQIQVLRAGCRGPLWFKLIDAEIQLLRAANDLIYAAELASVSHEQAKEMHVKDANAATAPQQAPEGSV